MNKRNVPADHDTSDDTFSHLDDRRGGVERINRQRPNRRPPGSERKRVETRRPQREGKWK